MVYPALLPLMPHTSAVSSRLNWRPPADLNGLANGVGSQYPSHYLGTWCIQHYYHWCAHLCCQQSTELTPTGRFKWTRPFRTTDEMWFLRVCHHISNAVYSIALWRVAVTTVAVATQQFILCFSHYPPPPKQHNFQNKEIWNVKCAFWFPLRLLRTI